MSEIVKSKPKKRSGKWRLFRTIWFSLITILYFWQCSTFQSRGLPENTFSDSDKISVIKSDDKITFESKLTGNTSEIIFFQGGLTDPKAYAPLCRKIAEQGFTCHLIKMNWRLPVRDYQKITDIFDFGSGNYIIGGHSQGGKMAAQFVFENPHLMRGLFLLGTTHPRDISLYDRNIPTLKLYAEYDGLASTYEVLDNKMMLPKKSTMILLEGGNHSQFGYLGTLFMDSSAAISLEEQQEETLLHLINHFTLIEKGL